MSRISFARACVNRLVLDVLRLLEALVLLGLACTSGAAELAIRGAGATFPYPVYSAWASEYKRETGVDVSYDPVGSGAGVDRIERKLVDFGASDTPLSPAEAQRIGVVQFPAVIGGVVPVVNMTGIRSGELKLSGQVLADIYLGKIRKWNEQPIVDLNPGLSLPDANITVVHRAESSGTTFLWSDFLARSSPEWKAGVGVAGTLAWPTGVAAVGNEGVASSVQRTKVSIGYVEYAYARKHNLSYVSVRNREGRFVQPNKESFNAAAAAARWQSSSDLQQFLIDPPGTTSWPITGASFVLLRAKADQASRSLEVMRFFDWAFRRGRNAAEALGYVPMPDSAVALIGRVWADQVRDSEGTAVWPAGAVSRPGAPSRREPPKH